MGLDISKLRYVLFDWDNTLAESRTALVKVVNQVLAEYGLPAWDEVKKYRDNDLSFRDNFPNIFGKEKAADAYERYAALYWDQVPSLIKTFPGVVETLEFFRRRQIPMIIVSNKDRRLLERELPILFNPDWFLRIVCGHEAARDKPYPEQIFYALAGLLKPEEITPPKVMMVGDSSQDSRCALAANARAVRIGCPIWGENEEPQPAIEYFADFKGFYAALAKN